MGQRVRMSLWSAKPSTCGLGQHGSPGQISLSAPHTWLNRGSVACCTSCPMASASPAAIACWQRSANDVSSPARACWAWVACSLQIGAGKETAAGAVSRPSQATAGVLGQAHSSTLLPARPQLADCTTWTSIHAFQAAHQHTRNTLPQEAGTHLTRCSKEDRWVMTAV